MKTSEQVTDEVLAQLDLGEGTEGEPKSGADLTDAFRSGWLDGDTVLNLMKAAIEADRAQRQPADVEITLPPEDVTPGEAAETIRQIADLIDQGYTSGYHPAWNLNKEL